MSFQELLRFPGIETLPTLLPCYIVEFHTLFGKNGERRDGNKVVREYASMPSCVVVNMSDLVVKLEGCLRLFAFLTVMCMASKVISQIIKPGEVSRDRNYQRLLT